MSVKSINISLDKDEYAFAFAKKGERTWKQVLFDGLEYKVYVPAKLVAEKPTNLGTLTHRHGVRKHKHGSRLTK